MRQIRNSFLILVLTALTACQTAPVPDYRIQLMPSADGRSVIAVPPECPSWASVSNAPHEGGTAAQYGCSQARNLAAMVERPEDLISPRPLGAPDGVVTAGSITAYRTGKTKALIDVNEAAPVNDITTGAGIAAAIAAAASQK